MNIESKCIHGGKNEASGQEANDIASVCFGSVNVPIFQTAIFDHPAEGEERVYDYSRLNNPTRTELERVVTALEGGADTIALPSGMAAISLFLELFSKGDCIAACCDLYGGTIRLFDRIGAKRGIVMEYADPDLAHLAAAVEKAACTGRCKAVFIETPTNPMMNVIDIAAAAELAHRNGAILVVDNTTLSPYFQNPIALGADLVIHSGTKFLCGHNDTVAGFLIAASRELSEELRELFKAAATGLSPFDSWLVLRGIRTMAVRMERQQTNAEKIVDWLLASPYITKVHYPGLPDHPGYEVSRRQARGFGSMLTFETDTPERAWKLLYHVRMIRFAESFGSVETLVTHPASQTHKDMTEEQRRRAGITEQTIRMSVGIEAVEDILADLEQALR